jgi:hypothetical protein
MLINYRKNIIYALASAEEASSSSVDSASGGGGGGGANSPWSKTLQSVIIIPQTPQGCEVAGLSYQKEAGFRLLMQPSVEHFTSIKYFIIFFLMS